MELALFYGNSDVASQVLEEIRVGYTCHEAENAQYTWTSNTIDKERAAKLLTNRK